MNPVIDFESIRLPPECDALRAEVRAFLQEEIAKGTWDPRDEHEHCRFDRGFGERVGQRHWIGLTWPKEVGGQGRSFLERYVLIEEYRAASAPTHSFSTADRQSGPVILKYGDPDLVREILPKITRGEAAFCIGLSEPNSGSDLFAASVKATKTEGGWRVNGSKIWTSNAHLADYMIGLFRTSPATRENRRHGLTQFLVDMKKPGITIRPIEAMAGYQEFNEVVFQDCFIEDRYLLGTVDGAWKQATDELAYERSGPERFLETIFILFELVRLLGRQPPPEAAAGIGRLVAQLHTLRRMSVSVNGMLAKGLSPVLQGSIVKNLGTLWEQQLPDRARELAVHADEDAPGREVFDHLLGFATLIAPKLTIQGGTTEVLRGIIARDLGLR